MKRNALCLVLIGLVTVMAQRAEAAPITFGSIFNSSGLTEQSNATSVTLNSGSDHMNADYGHNGVDASSQLGSVVSVWIDEFVVSGGTGTGTLQIQWSLDGDILRCGVCTTIFSNPSVGLSALFDLGNPSQFSSGTSLFQTNTFGSVLTSGTINVGFTYDQMFKGGFRLSASAGDGGGSRSGGESNFLNSADLSAIVLPDGATIRSSSGTVYPTVSAVTPVPEPATMTLLGFGLSGLVARRFSRKS